MGVGVCADSGFLRFMHRHLDSELCAFLEQTVPPAQLSFVSVFRIAVEKQSKQATVQMKLCEFPCLVVHLGNGVECAGE